MDGSIPSSDITGLVLAGGQGRRMGGLDKGLQAFRGVPLVMHALLRLVPQVGPVLINANQNLAAYDALGHPVVTDQIGGFAGPLAGLHAGLARCETPWLLSVPCDSPWLPEDLAVRLAGRLVEEGADLAVPRTGDFIHPVFCLVRADLADALRAFIEEGGRKVDSWHDSLRVAEVDWNDDPDAFLNLNTLAELHEFEKRQKGEKGAKGENLFKHVKHEKHEKA